MGDQKRSLTKNICVKKYKGLNLMERRKLQRRRSGRRKWSRSFKCYRSSSPCLDVFLNPSVNNPVHFIHVNCVYIFTMTSWDFKSWYINLCWHVKSL